MGKGSARRNEDIKKIWDNWDAIFGKKDEKPQPELQPPPAQENHEQKDAK